MEFRITNDGNKQDAGAILEKLKEFNRMHCQDPVEGMPLGIYYEDEKGEKLAGLVGETLGNWLSVNFLFVSDTLRGQGVGGKLLAAAEAEGKKRGCKYVILNTNSFQAPGFYQKMGYTCVFTQKEFPQTGEKYYFTKEI